MYLSTVIRKITALSQPVAVRLTAIVLMLSLALPMVMFAEWSDAKARTMEEKPRPVSARPEPFIMPAEKRGWEKLGERVSMLGDDLSGLFQAQARKPDETMKNRVPSIAEQDAEDVANSAADDQPGAARSDETPRENGNLSQTDAAGPETANESVTTSTYTQPAGTVDFDFDEDGKSDVGKWHPQTKEFKVRNSDGGTYLTVTFSSAATTAKPAPADYDADGMCDAAVFDNGTWYIRKSSDANTSSISFGQAGDIPASGNYQGGAGDELAFFRPSNGTWYWREFANATVYTYAYGASTDIPTAGDYDGDGDIEPAVYRPSNGYWFMSSLGGIPWGVAIDIPVAADYDGDGKTDPAIYRPTNGQWWYLMSSTGYTTHGAIGWGNPGDQPAVGDFDGDSMADFTVFRPVSGRWHTYPSETGIATGDSFGQEGDIVVPSSYLIQIGGGVTPDAINTARMKPRNATGGTDLYSQNFGWSRNLVSLPGRSGMDLNVGLSYNSLVWTKVGSTMLFDPDGNVEISPGFNIGFPTIEPAYVNADTSEYSYLMVTPGGSRVEFRQTNGASNVYETADSSYAQLTTTGATNPNDPVENITIKVVTTDGTQMSYEWDAGAFRCKQIKDRNGNYITIVHDPYDQGQINSITDTLGRVITFNYSGGNISTITQTWKGDNGSGSNTTHTYATFAYTTKEIQTDFDSGLGVWGPYNGTDLKVLEKVAYADGSFTKFYYNDYGQVWKVEEHAADSTSGTPHVLNHIRTNIESPSADQTDVPRYTQVWNKVENFNSGNETTATITKSTGQSYTSPAGGSAMTTTKIEVAMTGHPHNAISKSWYGESGWKDGLPIATEDWADGTSGSERKRWTLTDYTQDDAGVSYQTNPRVVETKIGDGTNTRRTTVDYHLNPSSTVAKFGLPSDVKILDGSSNVLKRSTTEYNFNTEYTSRRIIGLPVETNAWGRNDVTGNLEHVSKVTYAYDGDEFDEETNQIIAPIRHDRPSYGDGFVVGRGNLTSVTRHDVLSESAAVTSTMRYDIAGSVVARLDPLGRKVRIEYSDAFNDSSTPGTFAYPTKIFDPAGNFSTVKYRFDIGANVEAKGPAPAGQSHGKTTRRVYDSLGRLEKNSVYVDTTEHSYVRYEYPSSGIHLKVFSTLVDTSTNGPDSNDEVLSESWFDGAGRVRMSRVPHTFSSGTPVTWAGTMTEYDILGRITRESVPTEVDNSFAAAGDDYTRGFLWNQQEYDWMGRTTRSIPSDSTGSDGKDTLISYTTCGCAGGLETTVQGPLVPRDDQPSVNARRTQKSFADVLGRPWKTVSYKWDGTTAYTTTEQAFNGRDQVVRTRQIDNTSTAEPQTYQEATMTFDGHGRMKTQHLPIEDSNTNTTWNYNQDDSVDQVTDPRGAVTDLTYNSRGLITDLSYSVPSGSTIPVPAAVSFGYDNLGNRTSMSDGTGTSAYAYNELSQLTSETKTLTGLSGNYTLGYTYHMDGSLKSITDPFSSTVDYGNDKIGRLSSVEGSAFGNNTTGDYVGGIQYRAFGSIKQMSYKTDDNALVSMEYDDRLRVSNYQVASTAVSGGFVHRAAYEYNADSTPKAVDNIANPAFDRTFKYDFSGRLTHNQFGIGTRPDEEQFTVYSQTIQYDAFSNMTSRQANIWSGSQGFITTYLNGRRQPGTTQTLTFDAVGNVTEISYSAYSPIVFERTKFDAVGRISEFSKRQKYGSGQSTRYDTTEITTQGYDGDGQRVKDHKRTESTQTPSSVPQPVISEESKYFVRSSVTGKVITELNAGGGKVKTRVYMGSALLAELHIFPANQAGPGWSEVVWQHGDPVTGSTVQTWKSGVFSMYQHGRYELEPLGGIVPGHDPYYQEDINGPVYEWGGDVMRPEWGCTLPDTGQPAPCNVAAAYMNYLDRLDYTFNQIANQRDNRTGRGRQPIMPRQTIPDFIRADNRRDDEFENVPGLRRQQRFEGERLISSMWVVDNSTAAQNNWKKLTKKEIDEIRPRLVSALDGNSSANGVKCRDFLNEALRRLGVLGKGKAYNDIMGVFDAYAAKLRIYDKPGATGRAPFPASSPNARLEIDSGAADLALMVFHELLHGSGRIKSFSHTEIGDAMYRVGLARGFMDEREFFTGDAEKLKSRDENVAWTERNRVEKQYLDAGEEALKKACGGK